MRTSFFLLFLLFLLFFSGLSFAGQLRLSWSDQSENETEFRVYRRLTSSPTYGAPLVILPRNTQTYRDASVTPNLSYTYRLTAANHIGESPPSNEASGTFLLAATGDMPPLQVVSLEVPQPPLLLSENFESSANGANPPDWQDTAAGDSFVVDDTLFTVAHLGSSQALTITNGGVNMHSHYIGHGAAAWKDYTVTGRMWISTQSSGIGITFLSHFPSGVNHYYRIRRYNGGRTFHLAPHGTQVAGLTDTGLTPQVHTWYQFRIEVLDTGSHTEIKARLWTEHEPEPAVWQIDAVDASPTRLTSGTIGFWSWTKGTQGWDNIVVE